MSMKIEICFKFPHPFVHLQKLQISGKKLLVLDWLIVAKSFACAGYKRFVKNGALVWIMVHRWGRMCSDTDND